jgi:hypothetical protein
VSQVKSLPVPIRALLLGLVVASFTATALSFWVEPIQASASGQRIAAPIETASVTN